MISVKNFIKYGLAFSSGLAIGVGIGYLIAKKTKVIPKIIGCISGADFDGDTEPFSIDDDKRKEISEIIAKTRQKLERMERTDEDKYVDISDRYRTISGIQKPDLQDILNRTRAEQVEAMDRYLETEHPEDDWAEQIIDDEEGDAYFIPEDEFIHGKPHYDKISFRYYKGDGTLCEDDTEEILVDQEVYLGSFDIDTAAPGQLVHTRAPDLQVDFEIEVFEGSYHEIVLGMTDDEWISGGKDYEEG